MTWPINDRQNSPANIKYLAARRKTFEACNGLIIVGFLFALGLSIAAFLISDGTSDAAEILAIISLVFTIVEAKFIEPTITRVSRRNAALQEKFDCSLFEIDQNPHFAPDVSRASIELDAAALSNKKRVSLTDWYESDLGSLPKLVAAFVAQHTSTAYDHALRKFYLKILKLCFAILIVGLGSYLISQNDKFRESLVVSVVPFVPLVVWFIKNMLSNRELALDQEEALKIMDDVWMHILRGVLNGRPLMEAVRDNQDALYMRRASGTLIFPGIYKLKRSAFEGRAARTASTFRTEYEAKWQQADAAPPENTFREQSSS
jgi:hypothetical protein